MMPFNLGAQTMENSSKETKSVGKDYKVGSMMKAIKIFSSNSKKKPEKFAKIHFDQFALNSCGSMKNTITSKSRESRA